MFTSKLKLFPFLRTVRVKRGEPHNFQSLCGGLYNIPQSKADEFIRYYIEAQPHFSEKQFTSLVWTPPKKRTHAPFFVDLDLELTKNEPIPSSELAKLAYAFADIFYGNTFKVLKQLGIIVNRREHNYEKKKDGVTFFKCGVHIFFFGVNVTKQLAANSREQG